MTYSKAQDIVRYLSTRDTKAARLLKTKCRKLDRQPTFVIMRYGDPRKWKALPQFRDHRLGMWKRKGPNGKMIKVSQRRTKDWRTLVNNRPCILQRIDGTTIRAKSIADFCQKANLTGVSDKYHVTPVLDGHRPSFKGWFLPETLNRKINLRDVYGNVTKHKVRNLLSNNTIKITSIRKLLEGKLKSIRFSHRANCLMLEETEYKPYVVPRQIQIIKVKLTDGRRVYTGTSLADVAQKAGVALPKMYAMAYGLVDRVKNMRIKEIEAIKKAILPV